MHFGNMALSLLAQSLPQAVAYRTGWRKHEKSKLHSSSLQALYETSHHKKGVVLEKKRADATHPGQDKQGTVFEKKHSGTIHSVQGTASSEIPSVDREVSIECNPLSKPPDAGIFVCGIGSRCVKSKESELGGFCVAFEQAPILNRALQVEDSLPSCTDGTNDGVTCDCTLFNNTSGVGNFTCTYEECVEGYPTVCGKYEVTITIKNAYTYTYTAEICFEPGGGVPAESLCYSLSYDSNARACEFKVNDAVCSSCLFVDSCPANSTESGFTFDCTNTVLNTQGNTCELGVEGSFFALGVVPSAAPLDTPSASPVAEMPTTSTAPVDTPSASPVAEMPTTSTAPVDTPSTSPVEMPSSTTSSGSRHMAKVAIVVSIAGMAWLASFAT